MVNFGIQRPQPRFGQLSRKAYCQGGPTVRARTKFSTAPAGRRRTAVPIAASERSKPTRGETRFLVAGATCCSFERLSAGNLHQKLFGSPQTKRAEPSS